MTDIDLATIHDRLTPRQLEVLALVSERYSSKEIGQELNLSSHTVDNHIAEIKERLGAVSRLDAGRAYREAVSLSASQSFTRSNDGVAAAVQEQAVKERPEAGADAPPVAEVPVPLTDAPRSLLRMFLTFPPVGGSTHAWRTEERLAVVGRIAFITIVVLSATVALIAGVFEMVGRSAG